MTPDDKDYSDMIRIHLEKSEKAIDSSKILMEHGDYDGAANRAYYSLFHAEKALLRTKGIPGDTHKHVHLSVAKEFIKTGELPKDTSRKIEALEGARHLADYSSLKKIDKEQAKNTIELSEELLRLVKKLIERSQNLSRTDNAGLERESLEKQEQDIFEPNHEVETEKTDITDITPPIAQAAAEPRNMDPVRQAAQKISAVGNIDKSADGFSVVEGADVTEHQEKYLRDAVKGKQEIQEMETMNNTQQGTEKQIAIGDRVNIEMSNDKKITGEITKIGKNSITLQGGQVKLEIDNRVIREKGWKIKPAPPVPKSKTLEFAREKTKEIMGPAAAVAGAGNGRTYSGKIVGMTEAYAIQALNSNSAVLHKLEDPAKAEKDGTGQIKIREGESVSVTRDALGVVSLSPYDRKAEEQEKERRKKLQRGSQRVGSRGY
jgi:uncharacterized protein (UPF0332 family)